MKRALFALAVASSLLLASCSAEPLERLAVQAGTEPAPPPRPDSREHTRENAREPRAYLVPVTHLASPLESVTVRDLAQDAGPAVPRRLSEPLAELLDDPNLEPLRSAGAVIEHVSQTPGAIGLVPWESVDPRVKVLAVDDDHPLQPGAETEDHPLALGDAPSPDPEDLRRVVVAGDVVLDRGLPYAVYNLGYGESFPLDGGYAAVTWRRAVPSPYSESGVIHHFRAERRGGSGAMREYLRSADLTLANLENPVLRNGVWHPEGTTFHGDLRLLPLLKRAGIDGVALANNHILDAGVPGLAETIGHLKRAGISHAGAGMDLASARKPMIFNLGDTRIGVLNYQRVPAYEWAWATKVRPGTAPLKARIVREDVRSLKRRVDLVVVMPHWGREYTATPEPEQARLAREAVEAGADLVVGGHAHWAKGIEVYRGAPIFYGTGNFLFDQTWSEETSTGIFAEITLYGDRIIQARPIPFIVLDYAQPNFLEPEAGGHRALGTVFSASLGSEFDAYGSSGSP
ncbi:MAG: CapA family protein [Actinomycetota bacterium]